MYWFQGMVILAANQVWCTWEVEDTFMKVKKGDKMGLKNYSKKLHTQIGEVVVKVDINAIQWNFSITDILEPRIFGHILL